jgi:hypothetical protein
MLPNNKIVLITSRPPRLRLKKRVMNSYRNLLVRKRLAELNKSS